MFRKNKPKIISSDTPSERRPLEGVLGERTAKIIAAVFEIVQIGVVSLALVLLIRTFLVQPFYVKGASMEPNFLDHEYLLIDEISYRFRGPERGEIVVFRYPRNPREFFIKRVIGLPGEAIIISDGALYVNGHVLNEDYLDDTATGSNQKIILGSDQYFVLGDNRAASLDSRVFGPITKEAIVGRVWVRGWPPSRTGVISEPSYDFLKVTY